MDVQHGKNLNWLFELRGIGDYGGLRFKTRQALTRASEADAFVEFCIRIAALLQESD